MAGEPGEPPQTLVLERVPPPAAPAVTDVLVEHLGFMVSQARLLVRWVPLPCARGTAAELQPLLDRLRGAGAGAALEPLPIDRGVCHAHPRVPAAGPCKGCQRLMCLFCSRLGRPPWCAQCLDRAFRRNLLAVVSIAAAMTGLAVAWRLKDRFDVWPGAKDTGPSRVAAPTASRHGKAVSTASSPVVLRTEDLVEDPTEVAPAAPSAEPAAPGAADPFADLAALLEARDFRQAHERLAALEGDLGVREAWGPWSLRATREAARARDRRWHRQLADLGLRRYGAERDELLVLRAALARDEGRLEEAVADLRSVSPGSAQHGAALALLGECLHRSGDVEGARRAWEDLVRLGGPYAEAAKQSLIALTRTERATPDYETFTSRHFTLRCAPVVQGIPGRDAAPQVLRVLEESHATITRDLGGIDDTPIPAIVFGGQDWRHGRWVYGYYDPDQRTLAVNNDAGRESDPRGKETLAHELTHAVLDRLLGGRRVPRWLNEGLARYQGRLGGGRAPVMDAEWYGLKVLHRKGTLPALGDIAHYQGGVSTLTYSLGSALAVFIDDRYTFHRLRGYFAQVRAGTPHADAFRDTFGQDEGEFERQFHAYLLDHSTGGVSGQIGE